MNIEVVEGVRSEWGKRVDDFIIGCEVNLKKLADRLDARYAETDKLKRQIAALERDVQDLKRNPYWETQPWQ